MKVSPNIFRTYDIRGIYPDELNEEIAEHIGRAFGTYLLKSGRSNLVIGRDNRISSDSLNASVIKGLLSTGVNVTDAGLTLTPVIHYATCVLGFDSAVVVSASHNPKEYNGLKLILEHATPYALENLQKLRKVVEEEEYVHGKGKLSADGSILGSYTSFMKENFHFKGNTNVVVECGGGPASMVVSKVLKSLGVKAEYLNDILDSNFPQGVPNPEDPNFTQNLQKHVSEIKADVGMMLDTDGDRVGFVGESGRMYMTDEILLLLADDILQEYPGAEIIYDVKCSEVLESTVRGWGGVPKMLKTGRSYFEEEMKRGPVLGAEFAGHLYYAGKFFGYDDGVYAMLKVLEIIEKSNVSLDKLMAKYPHRVSTPEIKIPLKDELKKEAVEKILKYVKNSKDFIKIITLDGVRAYVSKTGWFLIRSSGTSPYLDGRMEAADEKEMVLVKAKFEEALQHIK